MKKIRLKSVFQVLFLTLVTTLATSLTVPVSGMTKELNRSSGKLMPKKAQRAPASMETGSTEVDKPLKIQGQSRNLSMMLVRKGEKDKIKFGEIRESYRQEIMKTHF